MSRIVTTVAPITKGVRKILFSKVVVTNIERSKSGYIVTVTQQETPYYPPKESNESFFKTGTALSNLGRTVPKELEGWRPFDSRFRKSRCFTTNVDELTEGMELPVNFHIKKKRTNIPQRDGHKPAMGNNGLILIDGKPVYTSYEFLTEYQDDEPNAEFVKVDEVLEGDGVIINEIEEWSI